MKDLVFSNPQKTFRLEYKTDRLDGMDNFTIHDIILTSGSLTMDDMLRVGLQYEREPQTLAEMKQFAVDNNYELDEFDYQADSSTELNSATALDITSTTLAGGNDSVAYDEDLVHEGGNGDVIYSLGESSDALPTGLTLSAGGKVSGTPTETGTFNLDIVVTDQLGQTDLQEIALVISA